MSMQVGQSSSRDASAEVSARYKYQRLRDRLRQAVQSGELSGKLPGERELARRYEANAKTVNKALCDLATEGLLVRHVGRGTFVSDGSAPGGSSRRKLLTYAWVCGPRADSASVASIHRAAETQIRERGHRLVTVRVPEAPDGEISESAVTPGQLRSWDGVVLVGRTTDRLLADLHRRHLPTVIVSNTHERIRTSVVLPDYGQGAFELAQYLVRLGHRRIRLVLSRRLMPAAGVADAGYRAALQRHGLRPVTCCVVDDGFKLSSILGNEERPTALVCVGEELATRAFSGSEAVEGPASRLSVCAIPEPGQQLTEPAFTAYETQAPDLAHWIVELLVTASPGQLPRTIIVPGQLVDRGSAIAEASGLDVDMQRPAQTEI